MPSLKEAFCNAEVSFTIGDNILTRSSRLSSLSSLTALLVPESFLPTWLVSDSA